MSPKWIAQFQREQLHRAARKGDLAKVKSLLLKNYPINRFDYIGKTPLHYAVACEHIDIVDELLQAGANVNAHDVRVIGDTPLGENAASCSFEMAKRLIEAGADPTISGFMMLTALDQAEKRQRPEGKQVYELLQAAAKSKGQRH